MDAKILEATEELLNSKKTLINIELMKNETTSKPIYRSERELEESKF
jgi:hypothetical protein